MAQNHIVTTVLNPDGSEKEGTEARLSAFLEDEVLTFEKDNEEIFRMDYDNFKEWSKLILKLK